MYQKHSATPWSQKSEVIILPIPSEYQNIYCQVHTVSSGGNQNIKGCLKRKGEQEVVAIEFFEREK